MEADALRAVPQLRAAGEAARAAWLVQRDSAAHAEYQQRLLSWQAAVERAEAAAADARAAAAAASAAAAVAAAQAAAPAAQPAAPAAPLPARSADELKEEGNVLLRTQQPAEAAAKYREALELDPTNVPVLCNLLMALNMQQRWPETEAVAAQLLQVWGLGPGPGQRSFAIDRPETDAKSLSGVWGREKV